MSFTPSQVGGPWCFFVLPKWDVMSKMGYAGIGFTTIRDVMRRFGFELSHTRTMDILNHLEIVVFLLQHPFLYVDQTLICFKDLVLFVV